MVRVSRQHPRRMGFCLTRHTMCLDQKSLYAVISPVARIQAVEVRVCSLTIIPNNSFVDFLLPVLATLNGWFGDLGIQEGTASTRGHKSSSAELEDGTVLVFY